MKHAAHLLLACAVLFSVLSQGYTSANSYQEGVNLNPGPEEQSQSSPRSIPAPPGTGPRPTIFISPSHGYLGQDVTVSGQGVSPYPSVRLSWLYDDATHTAAIAQLAEGNYSTTLTVPDNLVPGGYQICASVTQAELAELECTPFTVDPAPPGTLSGSIPLDLSVSTAFPSPSKAGPELINASAVLRTLRGAQIASAPVQPDGTFQFASIPAGNYLLGIVGTTPLPVSNSQVLVKPGSNMQVSKAQIAQLSVCANQALEHVASAESLAASINDLLTTSEGLGLYVRNGPYPRNPPAPTVNITFTAAFNGDVSAIQRVDFYYAPENGSTYLLGSDSNGPSWELTFDVSTLQEQFAGLKRGRLVARPFATSGTCVEDASTFINTISNPLEAPFLNGSLSWDAATSSYQIVGMFQDYPGLRTEYPNPPEPLPNLGMIVSNSVFGQVTRFEGSLSLNGDVHLRFVRLQREIGPMGAPLMTFTNDTLQNASFSNPSGALVDRIRTEAVFVMGKRDDFSISIPIVSMPFGVPYVFNLNFSIALGLQGGLRYQGSLFPWLGELDAYLYPSVGPHMTFTVELTLLVFFSGGADLTGSMDIIIPVYSNNTRTPPVSVNDPCFYFLVEGEVYTSVFWEEDTVWQGKITDYESEPGCSGLTGSQAVKQMAVGPSTRWMASPEIASAPDGRLLSVYVDNVTPQANSPTLKVMARFWDSAAGTWAPPSPLSDGVHMVHDPTVTFLGNTANAMVVWTQNTLETPQQAGNNIKTAMAYTDLYYAVWDGTTWSGAQRLTSNLLPDGFPDVSGTDTGVTLAWVRDEDGDFTTRTDWRIFINEWTVNGETSEWGWGSPWMVDDWGDTLMFAQPSIVRGELNDIYMAYTTDSDGDLATTLDRYVELLSCSQPEICTTTFLPVPPGSDSPSLTLYSEISLIIAFQVHGNGTSEGGPGTMSEIWQVYKDSEAEGGYYASPVTDSDGQVVYGESPHLALDKNGRSILTFRRFGAPGSSAQYGQLYKADLFYGDQNIFNLTPLTADSDMHWQATAAVNAATNTLTVLNVRRPMAADQNWPGQALSPQEIDLYNTTRLSNSGDPLESILVPVPDLPDPAVEPDLELSSAHAPPGSNVEVTATVTNLGRAACAPDTLTLQLRANDPLSGPLLGQPQVYSSILAPGETWRPKIKIKAGSGVQPIYAVLSTTGGDISTTNNQAYAELGEIPAPPAAQVNLVEGGASALQLTWAPPAVAGIAGYRILRGVWPSGPFELVGETGATTFIDWPIIRGVAYAYKIQAYDAAGVSSAYSPAAYGIYPLMRTFLAVIKR